MTYEEFLDDITFPSPARPIPLRACLLDGKDADPGMHFGLGSVDLLEDVLWNLEDHVVAAHPEYARRLVRNCSELLSTEPFGFHEDIAVELIASDAFDASCAALIIEAIGSELRRDRCDPESMLLVVGRLCEWIGKNFEPGGVLGEQEYPVAFESLRAMLACLQALLPRSA